MADVYFNGVAAAALSLYVDTIADGWWGSPTVTRPLTTAAPMLAGQTGLTYPMMSARPVRLKGRIITPTNTTAARVAAEAVLRDVLGNPGVVWLQIDDGVTPVRGADVYVEEVRIEPMDHPLLAAVSEVEIVAVSADPLWRAAAGTAVAVAASSTRYALPLGTAPSAPIIRVMGSATTPSILFRDTAGVIKNQIGLPTLNSTDYIDLDATLGTTKKYASGVMSDAAAFITLSIGAWPFALDPVWGDYNRSVWPTVETTAGTAEILYTKAYL